MAKLAMRMLASLILICMVVEVAMTIAAAQATIAPECKVLTPMFRELCGSAIKSNVTPDPACCTILTMGNSYMTDQAACQCYREAVQSIGGYSWDLSSQLPNRCNVHVDFPISRSVNCSSF